MSAPSRLKARRGVDRRVQVRRETVYPCMILGAGCSGLSLAWNLLERNVTEPILIVDRRDRFDNDRTWCFWDVEPTPFSDLASHSWTKWMVHDGRHEVVASCPGYRYLRVRSADVYRRVLDRLASAPNVTLKLGRPILDVRETDRRVTVATADGEFNGLRAFDSSGKIRANPGRPGLLQHFFGQTIRVDRAVFDPTCATLMDFRVSQSDGPHFVYLLPLSETEALVENTYLHPFDLSPDRHRAEIASYLQDRYDVPHRSFEVIEEESGAIPMTTASGLDAATRRIMPIGLSGGAARPSSGYAFLRIQRQARLLADRIAEGTMPSLDELRRSLGPSKYRFFDAVFLKILAERPELAPRIFAQMFDRTEPAALVRFLSEQSTTADDLRIIRALPKIPFMLAAARSIPDWFPTKAAREPG